MPISVVIQRTPRSLAAALFSAAVWLLTGDQDLLTAPPIPPTRIATAAQFASEFQIV